MSGIVQKGLETRKEIYGEQEGGGTRREKMCRLFKKCQIQGVATEDSRVVLSVYVAGWSRERNAVDGTFSTAC